MERWIAGPAGDRRVRECSPVGPQSILWFGIAGGSLALAASLLYSRFVRRDQQAVRSGSGSTLFAICLILFGIGAVVAGFASSRIGR
jgi:hypothetical protein